MTNLQKVIEQEAHNFARKIVLALRHIPLSELVELTGGTASPPVPTQGAKALASPKTATNNKTKTKRGRPLAAVDPHLQTQIIALVRKSAVGMRVDEIKKALGINDTKAIQAPITVALAAGRLTRMGERRGTTYFAK